MQVRAQFGGTSHEFQQFIADCGWFDGGDADPRKIRDLLQRPDDINERKPRMVVPADIHSREYDLLMPPGHQSLRFAQQIVYLPAAFMPTRKGNDAERAHEVAAVLHLEIRPGFFVGAHAVKGKIFAGDGTGMQDLSHRPPFERGQVFRKVHFVLRPYDQVDPVQLLESFCARLGIAAGHGDERVRRNPPEITHQMSAVGFRLLRDGAGIEDSEITGLSKFDNLVSTTLELIAQKGRLGLVQSAA